MTTGKTVPELTAETPPIVGTDEVVVYRSPGPLKRTTTATMRTYMAATSQPLDADLTAIAALTSAADKMPYSTGPQTWALADLTSFARTLLATASNSAFLTALGQIASSFVDFIQSGTGAVTRTVQAKLRDTVNVLDFGAVGDGVTDDATAITNAVATGKDILFPEGLTFLTAGNHSVATNNQKLIIKGTVKKKSGTVQSVFVVADQTQGVLFTGGGTIDGNRTAFTSGQTVSGILAFRAIDLTVDGIMLQNMIDDGIKAHNCPNLVVTKSTRFYNIYNMGVEMRSYGNDPRTGLPWVGVVYGPSGDIDGFYDLIDDGLHGAGNGVGVDFSPGDATAPDIVGIRVSGQYRDCLRAIFAENNVPSTVNVQDIVIDSPVILGNYRGSGTVETKDGIGVINCKNVQIIAPIMRNIGNFVPPGGVCAGIQISGNDVANIDIVNPQITDDTGAANRTDYGIYIGAGSSDDVRIRGGRISGMSDAPIEKGGAVNLRIEAVDGAATDQSWGNVVKYMFKISNIPATANTDLLWDGETGQDAAILGPPGRIVMVVARLTGGISSGSLGFKTYRSAVEETAVEIVNADWGGGLTVVKSQASRSATQVAAGAQIKVTAVSNSLSPTTIDAIVEVYVDIGMKA